MNNKGADETALMHRLIRAFVIFMKNMHFLFNWSNAFFQNWHQLIFIFQIVSKSYLKENHQIIKQFGCRSGLAFSGPDLGLSCFKDTHMQQSQVFS